MFDEIKCEYPLPDAPRELQEATFQTKCLSCTLETYTITANGRLLYHEETRAWKDDPSSFLGGFLALERVDIIDLQYHGDMRFYEIYDDEWWEFEARFTEGQLTRIKLVERRPTGRQEQPPT